eukprot:5577325-Pleurochrysis_carterae.AAC.2
MAISTSRGRRGVGFSHQQTDERATVVPTLYAIARACRRRHYRVKNCFRQLAIDARELFRRKSRNAGAAEAGAALAGVERVAGPAGAGAEPTAGNVNAGAMGEGASSV